MSNTVEGVIQGFNSTGRTAIVNGIAYGLQDPAFWKGAKEGDRVSFEYTKNKQWNNVTPGTVNVYRKDNTTVTEEDILETRKLALELACRQVHADYIAAANIFVDYLLGVDMKKQQQEKQSVIDNGFDIGE